MARQLSYQEQQRAARLSILDENFRGKLSRHHAEFRAVYAEAEKLFGPVTADMPHDKRMAFYAHIQEAKQKFMHGHRSAHAERRSGAAQMARPRGMLQ